MLRFLCFHAFRYGGIIYAVDHQSEVLWITRPVRLSRFVMISRTRDLAGYLLATREILYKDSRFSPSWFSFFTQYLVYTACLKSSNCQVSRLHGNNISISMFKSTSRRHTAIFQLPCPTNLNDPIPFDNETTSVYFVWDRNCGGGSIVVAYPHPPCPNPRPRSPKT